MKKILTLFTVIAILSLIFSAFTLSVVAADAENTPAAETEASEASTSGNKAIAAAIAIGIACAAGAFSMGWAISKAVDGIARQPSADGKIRTSLMLGLVFVETVIIYALITVILIIFVL